MRLGNDSPEIFRMFATKFGSDRMFRFHNISVFLPLLTESGVRAHALQAALIPAQCKHRMENVFRNVSVPDFVRFTASWNCPVVVDCSKVDFPTSDLLLLASMPNLVGLDLSGLLGVDDQFLYTLGVCLAEKSVDLKVLRVSGCFNVTAKGVLRLMDPSLAHSLCYIESDVFLVARSTFALRFLEKCLETHSPVPSTKWKLLDEKDPLTVRVSNLTLAHKLSFLLRKSCLEHDLSKVWDFKFFPESVDVLDAKRTAELFEKAWSSRLKSATTVSAYAPYCYLMDPKQEIVVEKPKKPKADSGLVFTRQGTMARKPVARKPKKVYTDVNTFFGLDK